jgi:hypothetical protein
MLKQVENPVTKISRAYDDILFMDRRRHAPHTISITSSRNPFWCFLCEYKDFLLLRAWLKCTHEWNHSKRLEGIYHLEELGDELRVCHDVDLLILDSQPHVGKVEDNQIERPVERSVLLEPAVEGLRFGV